MKKNVMFTYSGIYSAIKKNEILLFVGKWMELVKLGEISQAQKTKGSMFSLICGI
jgi:hypothetical protein